MKKTINELRDRTVEELRAKERELAQQLFVLRLNKSTGQLESPAKVRNARRELARVLTVLREKSA
jgi:large subunit ribosomal protein L29